MKKIYNLIRDSKIECLIFILFILFSILSWNSVIDRIDFSYYYTENRISGIVDFFSISVGIYIAVITILGTSVIGITKKLLETRLDERLINVTMIGMGECIISLGLLVFMDCKSWMYYYSLIAINLASLSSFIKFIIILVLIFKANLNALAKDIDEREQYEIDMLATLENILKTLKSEDK